MNEGLGCIIALAAIAFVIWLIGQLLVIVLFVILVVPIYIIFLLYLGLRFVATNIFVTIDKLFYLGFDVPVIMVWVFWGLAIGAAIQGYRELRSIYGRKWIGMLILITPVLLLTLVGVIKNVTAPPTIPLVTEQNSIGSKGELIKSIKNPAADMESTRSIPTDLSSYTNMVLIPAGSFQMGNEIGTGAEKPVHTVYLDSFYMDKYEVTYEEYKKFTDVNPEWQKDRIQSIYHDGSYLKDWNGNIYPISKDNHPVAYVSWYAAKAYVEWAGKRLPSEAEWEKAARGGLTGKEYTWGDSGSSHKANYGNEIGYTIPVGEFPENGYGLHDMSGNVHEWCFDRYDPLYYARSPQRNPIKEIDSSNIEMRVHRGGAWSTSHTGIRLSRRGAADPRYTSSTLGFRCVKSAIP